MEILESGGAAFAPPRAVPRVARTAGGAIAAVVAVAVVVAWEVARPTLPVPFELAQAARIPGASTWVGRLPMALAAIGGSIAVYMFLARTAERRAGVYAVAILATAPAWFVHGRTMTGAIVPMACAAAVLAGAGSAALDRAASARARTIGVAVALVAAVLSVAAERWGAPQRGLAVVAGVPLSAIGIAGVIWSRATTTAPARARERMPLGALVLGGALVASGIIVLLFAPASEAATVLLGRRATAPVTPGATTFESPVSAMAYGLVPWTSLVPFALARRPSSAGHLAIMIAAVLAMAAHAALAPRSGTSTIVGVAFVAGAVALMLRSIEHAARPASALVATVVVVGWLVAHDIGLVPDRALVAFGATDTAMPAAHAAASSLAIRSSIWLCVVLSSVALLVPSTWLPTGRGLAIVASGVFAGLVLRVHAYPELLSRLSPGAAFDAWAHKHRSNEPLGLVGIDRRAVAFAPGTSIVMHRDPVAAGGWLAEADHGITGEPRRFLALSANDLAQVSGEYRARRGRNVPILAGREGSTLLAVSALASGERSDSPIDAFVLAAPPDRLRPLGVVLEDRLEAVGWELVDGEGKRIDAVPRGSRKAHVRVVVRVPSGSRANAALGGYCTFLHVDHSPARFSAEHRDLPYPMPLWRAGDVVVDDYEVKLPPHFRSGSYPMFWGVGVLPCEDDRRMHITSGPHDGRDRVPAGTLEVR